MSLTYRPDVDGLRAIAILAVVVFHAFPEVLPGGFVGVDVFFVISGFLISGIIFEQLEKGRFSIWEFYIRRARRILPALLLVVSVCAAAGWVLLMPDELRELGKEIAGGAGFVSNLVFWSDTNYFTARDDFKPLLNLWSLGVEEQFYLLWPLALWLAFRYRVSAIVVIAIVWMLSHYYSRYALRFTPTAAFYSPLSRFWELLSGAALAWFLFSAAGRAKLASIHARFPWLASSSTRDVAAAAGAALVALSLVVIDKERRFPGTLAILPVAGTFLLIAAGPAAAINRWLLSHPFMVFIGLISYPLYLWHWPLLIFARSLLVELTTSMSIAMVAISVLLAWLTYRFIETPIRSRRNILTIAGLSAVTTSAIVAGVFVFHSSGYPGRFPSSIQAVIEIKTDDLLTAWRHERCFLSVEKTRSAFAAECVDVAPGRLIAIWGDSHGASLYAGARRLTPELRLAQFTSSDCLPLTVSSEKAKCRELNRAVISNLEKIRPDVVMLHANWSARWNLYSNGKAIVATIAAAKKTGRVILVGPAPIWKGSLPRILFAYSRRDSAWMIPERLNAHIDPQVSEIDRALRAIALQHGVAYVSPYNILCGDGQGCMTMVGTQLSAVDYGHLSENAAALVVNNGLIMLDAKEISM